MAIRTTVEKIQDVITTNPGISLDQSMATATALVDHIVSKDTGSILNDALLVEIETYLAAHFYALRDPQYMSQSRGKASAQFMLGEVGSGLKATVWGAQAIALDLTGVLGSISNGKKKLKLTWLGMTPKQETPHWDR